jgi:hypothetical protein
VIGLRDRELDETVAAPLYTTAQRHCGHPDRLDVMQLDYTKGTYAAVSVLGLSVAAYASGITSLWGWTILAGFIVLPALVMGWSWADRQTLSEIIHEARR